MRSRSTPAESGLVIVDKPADWTSHDVVARLRRLAGTRRVGHAGTLDPMATGVLVIGLEKATRLLGHLTLTEKAYDATIRLGQTTNTDDAEGEVIATHSAGDVTDAAIRAGIEPLTGEIQQVPPQVSAIKVNGVRSYKRAREGETVALAARPVTVRAFDVGEIRRVGDFVDVDASVVCSSGTYIRALARDLGEALGVGGHLTALRRTRVGPYGLDGARTLDELEKELRVLPIGEAVRAAFPVRTVTLDEARRLMHGNRIPAAGLGPGPAGLFAPDGTLLALGEEQGAQTKPTVVFATP